MEKAFELLHPAVQRKLWDMKWTELRPVQEQGIVHLLTAGGDCIISSPTASGKTEAAFLPILSSIAEAPRGSVRAMYLGPLKALINDQFRRIEDLCSRMDVPVHKWHGDVDASARKNLLKSPGGVLLITPESLEAMFVLRPAKMAAVFAHLDFVVIDELHAFLPSERGAQLRSQLHRLQLRAGCNPTRIGLSATIGEPDRALRWLRPNGAPATLISDAGSASPIAIRVRAIWRRPPNESKESEADPSLAELGRSILIACHGKTNLVFANSKSRIEEVADELATQAAQMCLPDEVVVHHGSLSKERRESAEARLRQDRPCTAVCSNTLEMGIDIGEIDDVVQVAAPWSVASLTQRLGRSGRRASGRRILRGFFVEDAPSEKSDVWALLHLPFIQGIAVIELLLEEFVEPADTERTHLSTLVHQVLSILAETGGIEASSLYERLVGAGSFPGVSHGDFAVLLRQLGACELLEQMPDRTLVLGVEGQRIVEHYTFYAAFNAASELRVVCNADLIGSIAIAPPPGEHLILAGRRWRVEEIDPERQEVLVSPARGRRAPWFIPRTGAIDRRVHEKMRTLLLESNVPAYLDETARDVLQRARTTATQCGGFDPVAQPFEVGVRAFVFGSSRLQQTLSIVLAAAGLRYSDEGVGFDVECDLGEFRSVLRDFAESPGEARLAAFADEKMRLRELGREKFERYLPSDLWRAAFVRDELDVAEAVRVAALLAK